MSDFIDRKELLKAMDTWDKFGYTHTGAFIRNPYTEDYVPYVHYEDMVKCVSNMPTADVQPVVRGEWTREYTLFGVLKDTFWHCSVCGYKNSDSFANFDHKYCPNCGARMGEE